MERFGDRFLNVDRVLRDGFGELVLRIETLRGDLEQQPGEGLLLVVELQHIPGPDVGEVLAPDDQLLAAEGRCVDVELVSLEGGGDGAFALPSLHIDVCNKIGTLCRDIAEINLFILNMLWSFI